MNYAFQVKESLKYITTGKGTTQRNKNNIIGGKNRVVESIVIIHIS